MIRVWVAATVAVVNNHSEQAQKLKSGIKTINQGKKRFFSGCRVDDTADLRPFSGAVSSEIGGIVGGGGGDKVSEESLRRVMYLSCWGPS